ncbi:MAG: tetratricopeptide repeat protein [Candidatus Pseudobacter hemicellulosilyticus]|uniref:Tetratricopeptide repeat protein n=1 Tax=Candidatus Pseudobacter hemicellulosilyticus TaxID=3121375 RepID=A0AAJ5WWW7_9BACT|nr:MAG: tetratricopeptide repeat protein [Pseudobacter sp.]
MKPLVTLLLLVMGQTVCASNRIDSLLHALRQHPAADKERLHLLNELAFDYAVADPAKGSATADEAIQLASQLKNLSGLASSYSNKGVNLVALGQDSLALTYYQQSLQLHQQEENLRGMARIYNNMAIVYVGQSDYARALDNHRKCYAVFEQLGNKLMMAQSLNNTGVVYLYLADYPRALAYYLKALAILEQLDNKDALAHALTNIGIIYKNLTDPQLALSYHRRAAALYEQTGNRQGLASTLGNMGVAYDMAEKPDTALIHYRQALAINTQLGNSRRIASDLTNMGIAFNGLGRPDSALHRFREAYQLYELSGDKNSTSIVLNQLGNLYMKLPDSIALREGIGLRERHRQALAWFQSSLQLAREAAAADRLSETWKALSEAHEQMNEPAKALAAYKQHILYRDSVYNSEKQQQVTRNEMRFEFEKKEMQAAAELTAERTRRNAIAGSAAILLLAVSTVFFFYRRRLIAEKKERLAAARAEAVAAEMKALRLQMNPHFIFNALNSISGFISSNQSQEADRFLVKFARLMRITLENSEQTEVELHTDLQALELYLELEALRHQQRFTYSISIDQSIDAGNTLIPPMLLQPFVENSILHGLPAKKEQGHIAIRVFEQDGMLYCTVADNGIGIGHAAAGGSAGPATTAGVSSKRSMGLAITRERISSHNKLHGSHASVSLTDTGGGTLATVRLPLRLSF